MIYKNTIFLIQIFDDFKTRFNTRNKDVSSISIYSFYKELYEKNNIILKFSCLLELALQYEIKEDVDLIDIEATMLENNIFLFELYDNSGEVYLNKCIDLNDKNKSPQHIDDFLNESFLYINNMIKN